MLILDRLLRWNQFPGPLLCELWHTAHGSFSRRRGAARKRGQLAARRLQARSRRGRRVVCCARLNGGRRRCRCCCLSSREYFDLLLVSFTQRALITSSLSRATSLSRARSSAAAAMQMHLHACTLECSVTEPPTRRLSLCLKIYHTLAVCRAVGRPLGRDKNGSLFARRARTRCRQSGQSHKTQHSSSRFNPAG